MAIILGHWRLRNREPVPVCYEAYVTWCRLFPAESYVALDYLPDCRVSTFFFAISFYDPELPWPRLFETMIFGGRFDGFQARYHTWDEAVAAHKLVVAAVQQGIQPIAP